MTYLTSSNHEVIIAAQMRISLNCGFPNVHGTFQWAMPQKAVSQELWFIQKPPIAGYNLGQFTQEQMMENVDMVNVVEAEYDLSWFAPPEAP